MADDLFGFEQRVAIEGYHWVECRLAIWDQEPAPPEQAEPELYLVPRELDGLTGPSQPMTDNPCLFNDFVLVVPSEDDIAEFAGQYGLLGDRVTTLVIPVGGDRIIEGESLRAWRREIRVMKCALDLWQAILDEDVDTAVSNVQSLMSQPLYGCETANPLVDFLELVWEADSAVDFALIDELLDLAWDIKSCVPLYRLVNNQLASLARPRTMYAPDSKKFKLFIAPFSLLGCLWLQFAHLISGNTNYKRCSQCGVWFPVEVEGKSTREFCSDACRSKHERAKQAEAIRLHQEGVRVLEIAKRLSTKVDTIRGWIETVG